MTTTLSGFSALLRYFSKLAIAMTATVMLVVTISSRAQSSSQSELTVQPTAADRSAALAATTRYRHVSPAHTAAGQALRALRIAGRTHAYDDSNSDHGDGGILLYPGDFGNDGGQVVKSAVSHAIYLQSQPGGNCTMATCWGDPEAFLRDLGNSDFIHVVDQYVGLSSNNRYTVGFHATVNYTPPVGPLLDSDIAAIVHAVAVQTGASGYGHIYQVFLPPGQDTCVVSWYCYSPDNEATFYYCAYHDSTVFPDIGEVLFNVHPYANVPGCQVQPGTLNGTLVDSVNAAVGHELIEAITDPDGDTWRNISGAYGLGNYEIADECQFYVVLDGQGYGDVPTFQIGAHRYAMQLIYSNEQHVCTSAPLRGNP